MAINDEAKLNILTDHYKDTYTYVREHISTREKMFSVTIMLLALQIFQVSDPKQSSDVLISILKAQIGINILANISVLNTVLWFSLLAVIVKYFQANIYINRQYDYLHHLEDNFKKVLNEKLITREGAHYLNHYPKFSNWINFLYAWVFPLFLILAATYKIINDWRLERNFLGPYAVSVLLYILIVISTILYLIFLHSKKKPEKTE